MSLVRAQLGEPQQSSLLTTLFSFWLYVNSWGSPKNLVYEVLRIVKESESKDEAVEKLQGLIENKNSIFGGNQCQEKII